MISPPYSQGANVIQRSCLNCGTRYQGSGYRCRPCHERARGSRQERGYDRNHDRARRSLAAMLPAPCGYGDGLVYPTQRWVAAHVVDGDPTQGWMPSHHDCNERAKRGRGGANLHSLRRSCTRTKFSREILA